MTEPHANHGSIKTYLMVFVGLGLLTALTVSLSYLNLSHHTGIFLAALIALAKCALIAAFFMHLRSERLAVGAFFFVGLIFVIVLVAAVIPDIGMVGGK